MAAMERARLTVPSDGSNIFECEVAHRTILEQHRLGSNWKPERFQHTGPADFEALSAWITKRNLETYDFAGDCTGPAASKQSAYVENNLMFANEALRSRSNVSERERHSRY